MTAGPSSLIVQTSFLGDVVLTTPLIEELARRGPVDVVVTPAAAPLLEHNPRIRHLVVYDKRGRHRGARGLWSVAREIRALRSTADPQLPAPTAYLAQGSVRSAALAWLAGCPERVGFESSAGRRLYTRRLPLPEGRHHAERLWSLAGTGTPSDAALRPRLYPGDAERSAVDALLGEAGSPPGGSRFVALAPGSVWQTKRWPYFAELAGRLVPRWPLVIVGGPADPPAAREIIAAAGAERVLDATGRLSLLGSAELIGRAALLVTNDSSPQHLASAMGTPTITLFGPTVPAFGFGPLAAGSLSAGVDALACRPCHHHGPPRCPLGHWRCMRELGVAHVESLVTSILD